MGIVSGDEGWGDDPTYFQVKYYSRSSKLISTRSGDGNK